MPIQELTINPQNEMPWKTRLIWFSVICIFSIATYYPSLEIVTHRDNDPYFLDTEHEDSLSGLIFKYYSYNRVRKTKIGDTMMFRPGVFVELGFMRWAVGPENPQWWQLLGIAIHLLACFTLLLLVTSLWPTTAACLCVLFFSVMSAGKFMVEYCHATMFMAALAAVIYSCYVALHRARRIERNTPGLVMIMLCMTFAAFTLEFFGLFSLFIFVYLVLVLAWDKGGIKKIPEVLKSEPALFLLILPPLIYGICDLWDMHIHADYFKIENNRGLLESPEQITNAFGIERSIYNACAVTGYWILQNIFLPTDFVAAIWLIYDQAALAQAGGLLLVLAALILFRSFNRKKHEKPQGSEHAFFVMSFLMGALVLLVYILFRINVRGLGYAVLMPLYPYFFWCCILIAICALLGSSRFHLTHPAYGVVCVLIVLLTIGNALRTHSELIDKAEGCRTESTYLAELRDFVNAHKHEPNFSINTQSFPFYFFKYTDKNAPRYIITRTPTGHLIVKDSLSADAN